MAKDKKKEPEQTPETQEQKAEASQPEEAEKKECPPAFLFVIFTFQVSLQFQDP